MDGRDISTRGVQRPRRFEYRLLEPGAGGGEVWRWDVYARRYGRAGGPWTNLGEVAPDTASPDGRWRASLPAGKGRSGGFLDHHAAASWLWKRHVEALAKLGPATLERLMTETPPEQPLPGPSARPGAAWEDPNRPEPEFRRLAREAGLSVRDAGRCCQVRDARTSRRWAHGLNVDGTPVVLTDGVRETMAELVEEHRRALALEEAGMGEQRRPLRERRLAAAMERERRLRGERQASGKPGDPSGRGRNSPSRRARNAERAAGKAVEAPGGGGGADPVRKPQAAPAAS